MKIGGSVLTNKSGDCAIDYQCLARIAEDISEGKIQSLLLVHGAGSCGHPQARQYHLDQGLSRENVRGMFETHTAVCSLNKAVVTALRTEGVDAIGISPIASAVAADGRLISFEIRPLALMMESGIVPVLHGDVVMDRVRGASIVSGDQLVAHLASALPINRVGVATDVSGVLHEGRTLLRLHPRNAATLTLGESTHPDVTGGMRGKIAELVLLAERGIESHVFHVSRIRQFLDGSDHGGTVIEGRI